MSPPIDYKGKTTKELLIEVIGKVNELCEQIGIQNGHLTDHEKRLLAVETYDQIEAVVRERGLTKRTTRINLWAILIPAIALLLWAVYAIGQACGWW